MRRRDFLKSGAALPLALLVGCNERGGTDATATSARKDGGECCPPAKPAATKGKVVLCHMCGQIKGSELCCKAGADKCTRCGLHKGSPGCCRLGGATKDVCLCTYCGEIKGSEKCCKPGLAKCSSCGLNKGSPGCCRIKKECA